jgi:hypothetical protein
MPPAATSAATSTARPKSFFLMEGMVQRVLLFAGQLYAPMTQWRGGKRTKLV